MLARRYRLPIQFFPRQAKTILRSQYFLMKIIPNDLGHNRLGVLVGRGVLRKPSGRNKVRRLVMDFLASRIKKDFPDSSKDVLVIVKTEAKNLSPKELLKELQNHDLSL